MVLNPYLGHRVYNLNQNQTNKQKKVPNLLSFSDLHVIEKSKQEGCVEKKEIRTKYLATKKDI